MSEFGPEYPKIQTAFKRDDRGRIISGAWTLPEFEYLRELPWRWTEKVDGTNIRLHWDGVRVTLGGRTDNAQVPARLVDALKPQMDPDLWRAVFPPAETSVNVTVYGEGYGAKIQSGGQYRADQALIVFDVLVGRWWLTQEAVADVAGKLGLEMVPPFPLWSLERAWVNICGAAAGDHVMRSQWPGAQIEGIVGRPAVDLFSRNGERVMTKLKLRDFAHLRNSGDA